MRNWLEDKLDRDYLRKRMGDLWQVGGVRRVTLREGLWEGSEAVIFRTGTGFSFWALPSRGLDISHAEYRGIPLAWLSASGEVHPSHYEPEGLGWLRGFFGGLVATCGMTYMGAPCTDQGKELGLHGRYSYLSAFAVWADAEWGEDGYEMWAEGKVREAALFMDKLELKRRISAVLGESRLWISDTVTNIGFEPSPLMLLYHINIGYPVIDEGSELVAASRTVRPRDEVAKPGIDRYSTFEAPQHSYKEQVFYHEMAADESGYVTAALINPRLAEGGLGVYVRYRQAELPYFTEWKQMGEGDYVVGMEPGNALVEGRAKEREYGTLQTIEPGQVVEFNLEIGVLDGAEAIAAHREAVSRLVGREGTKILGFREKRG